MILTKGFCQVVFYEGIRSTACVNDDLHCWLQVYFMESIIERVTITTFGDIRRDYI